MSSPNGSQAVPLSYNSSSFQPLPDVRNSPLWKHITISRRNEIVMHAGTSHIPFDLTPLPVWRFKAWRKYTYPLTTSIQPWVSKRYYDSDQLDISIKLYRRLYPALQLATMFVVTAHRFFVMVDACPVIDEPRRYDPDWAPQEDDYDRLGAHILNDLATEYRIVRISPQPAESSVDIGLTTNITNVDVSPRAGFAHEPLICCIATEVLDEVESDTWLDKNEMQQASILTHIADTLAHELAHAVYNYRQIRLDASEQNYIEPTVWPEVFSELGWSLNRFLFGFEFRHHHGLFLTREDREAGITKPRKRILYDCSMGVRCYLDIGVDRQRFKRFYIALESTTALFNMQTWLETQRLFYLFPERDGSGRKNPWPYADDQSSSTDDML